jgi:hypothetical protein
MIRVFVKRGMWFEKLYEIIVLHNFVQMTSNAPEWGQRAGQHDGTTPFATNYINEHNRPEKRQAAALRLKWFELWLSTRGRDDSHLLDNHWYGWLAVLSKVSSKANLSRTIILLCSNHHIMLLSSPQWEPSTWLASLSSKKHLQYRM